MPLVFGEVGAASELERGGVDLRDSVCRAVEYAVDWGLAHRDLSGGTALGIDEVAWQKGHQYLTLVYDISGSVKRLLSVTEDRKEASLRTGLTAPGTLVCGKVRFVCCDLWKPYLTVIEEQLSTAPRVGPVSHPAEVREGSGRDPGGGIEAIETRRLRSGADEVAVVPAPAVQPPDNEPAPISVALNAFRATGGMLRTRDALNTGIHPRTLYELRDSGRIEQLSRSLFRLAEVPSLGNPDLVTVALKIPDGVLCLISALAWHELTTQIPHETYVAIPRGAEPPRLNYPPVRHFWFSGKAYSEGIEAQNVDGIPHPRVYCREKTIVDCFKHRNRIGLDTVLEILKAYRQQGQVNTESLLHYAEVCRVKRVIQPYLEVVL